MLQMDTLQVEPPHYFAANLQIQLGHAFYAMAYRSAARAQMLDRV
jgi:hypothetical protein